MSNYSNHPSCIVALVLAVLPSSVSAYCVGWDKTLPHYDPHYYSVSHEFFRSSFVIKARVVKETWIGEDGKEKKLQPPFQYNGRRPWGFDPYMGAYYDLKIVTAFKGSPPAILRVFSENSTARFWLRDGQEILAFVSPETFDQPVGKQFTLDICGNLASFPKAKAVLPAVLTAAKAFAKR